MKTRLAQMNRYLSLVVLFLSIIFCNCVPSNSYPVISSLEAEKDSVTPSGSCEVKCIASDPDGDNLTYTWSVTGGVFSGTGPVVTWIAPNVPGSYILTVKVTDDKGGETAKQVAIEVIRVNHLPVIESLTAEPLPVKEGKTTTIKCVVHDPDGDELSYSWSTARGSISGQGSTVTWIAPNSCGDYIVAVTVVDGRGGEVSKELEIKVIKPG